MASDDVVPQDWPAAATLEALAAHQRIVMLAGLPGVGKSLLLRHLARMARHHGRRVFLLQWDVARGGFETEAILARYPEVDGFTHAGIKRAAGLWARDAVLRWHQAHPSPADVLLGETPLVGGRLIELARPAPDDAEALLASEDVRFLLPVPTRDVRAVIEAARERSIADPAHARERADAPPNVLRQLWQDVYHEGHRAGLVPAPPAGGGVPYDPDAYRAVYTSWLGARRLTVIEVDFILPASGSVYDVGAVGGELTPSPRDVDEIIRIIDAEASQDPRS